MLALGEDGPVEKLAKSGTPVQSNLSLFSNNYYNLSTYNALSKILFALS